MFNIKIFGIFLTFLGCFFLCLFFSFEYKLQIPKNIELPKFSDINTEITQIFLKFK